MAFGRASDAVAAAEAAQNELAGAPWPGPALGVRMGLHLGEAEERAGDYFGSVVNLTARLEAAAHGGQVLMTDPVRQAARAMARDLGVHQLRDVAEPIRVWQLGDGEFPPLRVVGPPVTYLPAASTPLVGRAKELRQARDALTSSRLVTLTAGGGTGKTRLALAVGEAELPHRADGVWFVDLTPLSDGALVGAAIAATLGLQLAVGDVVDQVVAYTAGKDLLVILDNCEHLIEDCAEFAERVLLRPGRSVVLATSRERLDVAGERVVPVPPLAADDNASPAVELFTQRAIAAQPSFTLTAENAPVVAELCRRLDGMPLAIELAAARTMVLSPAELLAGIDQRFQLLHSSRRRLRGRTLEATLDWSYDLLDNGEQAVLRALGVFVGTFDLDAVAAIADLTRPAAVDAIESLIAKSLVVREDTRGPSRFRLFETTALYARQHLAAAGEASGVGDRHLAHYLDLTSRYFPGMFADVGAAAALASDRHNIVAAFEHAGDRQDWTTAAQLLLGSFAVFQTYPTQGVELVERCVNLLADGDLAMRLVCNEWLLHTLVSDHRVLLAATRQLRDSPSALHRTYGFCLLALQFGATDGRSARQILDKAFASQAGLAGGPDGTQAMATCEIFACVLTMLDLKPEAALAHAQTAARIHHDLGFESAMSAQLYAFVASCRLMLGDPHGALEAAIRYGLTAPIMGTAEEITAIAYAELGHLEQAAMACRAHARIAVTGRVLNQVNDCLLALASLANAEGDRQTALELLLTMGSCRQSPLIAYSRHLAQRLGIAAELEAVQAPLRTEPRDPATDMGTLRNEIVRRQWQ